MVECVAIPKYLEVVAPRFEAARSFVISRVKPNREIEEQVEPCLQKGGFSRIRLLQRHHVDTLVCNGIKAIYRDMLMAMGIRVFANVATTTREALDALLAGELPELKGVEAPAEPAVSIPVEQMVRWARCLMESHGYEIAMTEGLPFPIDMVGEIVCPGCGKRLRVAVSCGPRAYRADLEIRELVRVASRADYDALAYVHPLCSRWEPICRELGVLVWDPAQLEMMEGKVAKGIPLLPNPFPGHERAMSEGAC